MSKKILAIYYTQTGQLEDIIDNLVQPLIDAGESVEKVRIRPSEEYPFPWKSEQFFSLMPDCVLDVPTQLKPFELKERKYDLIVLGYQAWFLSPCIPINSLLEDPSFKLILNETPVVTVTGARNMWISAFQRLKKKLQINGANLVGNIALVDRHHNIISLVTLVQWMFKGKKEKYLGILPKPGVSEEDIKNATIFGKLILFHINQKNWRLLQADLINKKAVEIKYRLMYIENTASKLFSIWANLIAKRENKKIWLVLFKYYLLIALLLVAPIILTVDAFFVKPFSSKKIRAFKEKYLGVI